MRLIPLTQGRVTIVDDADYEWLSQYKWYFTSNGHKDKNGYAVTHINGKTTYLHRMFFDIPKDKQVDHINGKGLDNRRKNLRLCTRQQNIWHRKKDVSRSKQPYKGVTISGSRYRARIAKDGIQYCLGTFNTALGARRAYLQAAKELHGEFAQ